MTKRDGMEFDFDLLDIEGENVFENFKLIFGKKLKEKQLNYELVEIEEDSKKRGGGVILKHTANTFPYSVFSNTMDVLFKKEEVVTKKRRLYDALFNDLKDTPEEKYSKFLLETAAIENGYFKEPMDQLKNGLENTETEKLKPAGYNIESLPVAQIDAEQNAIDLKQTNDESPLIPSKEEMKFNVGDKQEGNTVETDKASEEEEDDSIDGVENGKGPLKIKRVKLYVESEQILFVEK